MKEIASADGECGVGVGGGLPQMGEDLGNYAEDLTTPDCKRQIGHSGDELETLKNLQFVEIVLPDDREDDGTISVARIAPDISSLRMSRKEGIRN